MNQDTVGFVGSGQMARAIARGLVDAGMVKPEQIHAADPSPDATSGFLSVVPGARIAASNLQLVRDSRVVILAIKPQMMPTALREIQPAITAHHLVVSVAAGVSLSQIAEGIGSRRVIRVMPNTPCLVGEGASAYSLGPEATADDERWVAAMLDALGRSFRLDESLLDAVTGLSGSGPAYAFVMIEALSDGGVRMGLPRNVATILAAQTLAGAAAMVLDSGEHPASLKDKVASPGGTTIAGLQALEDRGVRAGLIAAVEAATRRSRELGTPRGPDK